MSEKKTKNNFVKQAEPPKEAYPLDVMADCIARCYLIATAALLPILMDETKYSAITKFKGNTFTAFFFIASLILALAFGINSATRVTPYPTITRDKILRPPFIADAAILAYWVCMLISSICAVDSQLAFSGLSPRNNGFLFQTMYVITYFIVSRGLKPRCWDALIFAWGGAVLGVVSTLHFYGVDLYNIASVNGADYGGPFWTTTKYRFLGPVGNVNLGSYILATAAVITAGLYIAKVRLKWDRFNLITLACFAIIIYSEYNINTDAGVVALAVAAILMPAVLCGDMGRLRRLLRVYLVAIGLLFFNYTLVDVFLRGEKFGNTGTALLLLTLLLAVLSAATTLAGWKKRLSFRWQIVSCAAAGVAISAAGFIVALLLTAPSQSSAATESTVLHKIGGALRTADAAGTLKLLLAYFACALAVGGVSYLYALWNPRFSGKLMRRVCLGLGVFAIVGGLSVAWYITAPEPAAAGSLSGASAVIETVDLKAKSDTMVHELGQMLRGNFDDSFGHNRLFTWKRTLRLVKLHPIFGIGPDNFKAFFATYFHDEAVKQFPSANGSLDKAHNEFLDVLLDNGIAGLITFLAFFGGLLWYAFRRIGKSPVAPVFGVAVVAYMAHAFFGYQLPIQSPGMWMIFAVTAAFIRAEWNADEESGQTLTPGRR